MTQQPPMPPPGNPVPPPPGSGYPAPAMGPPAAALPTEAYTSWIQRVGAYLIDAIPVAVAYGIAFGIGIGTGNNSCVTNPDGNGVACSSSSSGVGIAVMFLAWLGVLAYAIWNWGYRQGTTGSSVGKSVLKFKVVSEATGQPIGFGMSFVRQLAHIVDSAICGLGYLFPLWDAKRQTLADKIMSTVCVPIT
ncbi:RDD family protein [Mycobacterium sp.]|uniref:RDD family protein n=1 Tax=Mycobacterium sp. TaxID=1785 RepID=UPI003C719BC4